MLRKFCLLFLVILGGVGASNAQLIKEYRAPEKEGFDLVLFEFSSYKSSTHLKRVRISDPIAIHGHLEKANILPYFSHQVSDNILYSSLVHKNVESDNLGKSITSKIFSSGNDDFGHSWDISLNSNFLYHLDFTLGVGKAEFDLAQLPISQLKVKSASADVKIHYGNEDPNRVRMDTLLVTLNMGTVNVQSANFTNAKKMIFEVNYGNLNLNFSDGMSSSSSVIAAVGAGTLKLKLPPENFPVRIKVRTTAMCRTSIPKFLRSLGDETYVSKGYDPDDPNLLELIVDVGVGSLTVE
ncbi:hypothetical protein SAMN04488519_108222 [Algoriphagus ornithinivorans]|uniref:Adhesin domain-containing protein n=1 Tax=Algoriphagus ornithinivorans TaxID=226506 RepID=A0A1I5IDU4_9BACT|nr:hypothetical protein [Algoriphagus ornithinivorans]SFO58356.1 hypothetical protein SAMN04488519_108222 [Algoriphagus ornithinivorans]